MNMTHMTTYVIAICIFIYIATFVWYIVDEYERENEKQTPDPNMKEKVLSVRANNTVLTITLTPITYDGVTAYTGSLDGSLVDDEQLNDLDHRDTIYKEQCGAIEIMLIALACQGVDIESDAFKEAIQGTLKAIER